MNIEVACAKGFRPFGNKRTIGFAWDTQTAVTGLIGISRAVLCKSLSFLSGKKESIKSFNTNLSINQQRCGLMKISSRILRVTHCQCQKKNKRLKPLL
jgi:hypothetical protein